MLSHVQAFVAPWTVACQVPLSIEFSRQAYWSGLPFPTPGDLSGPEIKPTSLASPALASKFFTTSTTWEAQDSVLKCRDITLPTKAHTVKDMDFLVVMYGCGSWTTEHQEIDAF